MDMVAYLAELLFSVDRVHWCSQIALAVSVTSGVSMCQALVDNLCRYFWLYYTGALLMGVAYVVHSLAN